MESSSFNQIDFVDLGILNSIAHGSNKKIPRIIASGIGGKLMGTREMVDVEIIDENNISKNETNNVNQKNIKPLHISEQAWTFFNFYKKINWLNTLLIVLVPAYGIFEAMKHQLRKETFLLALSLYVFSGISITAGYHRLFSHRCYDACTGVKLFFAFFGAGAIEGSIKWWSHSHRIHHRYTDTNRDPYDARRGFWFSHMGWMLMKSNPKNKARADISDLIVDKIVAFQHRHYLLIMIFVAFIFPTMIAGLFWNDYWGGFIYGGILKTFVIQQATFCVNSLAHWIGVQPFDDRRTPKNHFLTAIVTFGEGYHNFHHEFPSDYRNALKWYQYDPTKIVIYLLYKLGLAYNLKTFSQNAIKQGLVQQMEKKIIVLRNQLDWGVPFEKLPVWSKDDFLSRAKNEKLIIIDGVVYSVKDFYNKHPGGKALLLSSIGKDATEAFNGGVYNHSNAAHNLLSTLRVSVIKDSNYCDFTNKIKKNS